MLLKRRAIRQYHDAHNPTISVCAGGVYSDVLSNSAFASFASGCGAICLLPFRAVYAIKTDFVPFASLRQNG